MNIRETKKFGKSRSDIIRFEPVGKAKAPFDPYIWALWAKRMA